MWPSTCESSSAMQATHSFLSSTSALSNRRRAASRTSSENFCGHRSSSKTTLATLAANSASSGDGSSPFGGRTRTVNAATPFFRAPSRKPGSARRAHTPSSTLWHCGSTASTPTASSMACRLQSWSVKTARSLTSTRTDPSVSTSPTSTLATPSSDKTRASTVFKPQRRASCSSRTSGKRYS